MNILITGGCGFIGANLVRYLADKDYKMKILDNLSAGKKENLLSVADPLEVILGDIREWNTVSQAVEDIDVIVHLAAHTSVVESLQSPKEDWDINAVGTFNLLEACRQKGVKRFVFASSNAALGEQASPIDETKVPQPLSPYGASKLAGEALCSSYYHSFGLKTISLRFANCYGPYSDHKTSVVAKFMKWAREGKSLIIYGDGNQTRDFIHVDDVCQAIYLSLTASDPACGEVFQIATGSETAINELAEMIKGLAWGNIQVVHEPERRGEIRRNYSEISKARAKLGFEPNIKLSKGLEKLWACHSKAIQ